MDAEDVEDVLGLFLSHEYFDKWILFISDNATLFSRNETCAVSGNQYTLKQYEIFDHFTELIEGQLNNCCKCLGFSTSEFYETCKRLSDSRNAVVDVFCTLVLSSTEFQLFADIMQDVGKRDYFIQIIQSWRNTLKGQKK
jgi:hypothetical protein